MYQAYTNQQCIFNEQNQQCIFKSTMYINEPLYSCNNYAGGMHNAKLSNHCGQIKITQKVNTIPVYIQV